MTCVNFSNTHRAFLANIDTTVEPASFSEAMKDAKWLEAMGKEIKALEESNRVEVGVSNYVSV